MPPSDLRRTVEAVVWRCTDGATWRSVPAELGPWRKAARIVVRWARLGVWIACWRWRGRAASNLAWGHASRAFREHVWSRGARPAIPPERDEAPVACPDSAYANRDRVEPLRGRPKEWRAVATRHEETAASFMGVLCLATGMDRLRR